MQQMVVNINSDDETWQVHLDGLLNLIARSPVTRETAYLHNALEFMKSGDDISISMSTIAVGKDPNVAYLLLDVTKLQLRQILPDIHDLFEKSSKGPRKIDVQKIKVEVKKICTNLELFPVIFRYESDSTKDNGKNLPIE